MTRRGAEAEPRLVVTQGSFGGDAPPSVLLHHFAHQVEVLIPGEGKGEAGGAEPPPVFTVATVRPDVFLDEAFAAENVRPGGLYCLSSGPAVDRHNTLCVAGGVLRLTVDAATYAKLGLDGRRSRVHPDSPFHLISLPIASPAFKQGDAAYERAKWCLARLSPVRLLAARVVDDTIHRVSFPPAFAAEHKDAQCKASTRALPIDVRVPDLSAVASGGLSGEEAHDLLEWLGLMACEAPGSAAVRDAVDDFASLLRSPQALPWSPGRAAISRVRGFLPPAHAVRALARAREKVKAGECAWAAVSVWGFEDAPVSWGRAEHSVGTQGGDNVTVVVVLPGGEQYVVLDAVGGLDTHR